LKSDLPWTHLGTGDELGSVDDLNMDHALGRDLNERSAKSRPGAFLQTAFQLQRSAKSLRREEKVDKVNNVP